MYVRISPLRGKTPSKVVAFPSHTRPISTVPAHELAAVWTHRRVQRRHDHHLAGSLQAAAAPSIDVMAGRGALVVDERRLRRCVHELEAIGPAVREWLNSRRRSRRRRAMNEVHAGGLALTRGLGKIAEQINECHGAISSNLRASLESALEAGQLLQKAKERLPHGQWLPWIADNLTLPQRTVQMYMRVARNWPRVGRQIRNRCAFDPARSHRAARRAEHLRKSSVTASGRQSRCTIYTSIIRSAALLRRAAGPER